MGRSFRFPSISKSPSLISAEESGTSWNDEDGNYRTRSSQWSESGQKKELGTATLVALTCSAGGLQVVWSLIMSNGTPFLITLGLPESMTAMVWVVAPLSGVVVQPYVGVLSDRCQLSWGRRRPFIAAGAIVCILSMLGLASTKSFVHLGASFVGADIHGSTTRGFVLASAVLWIIALNLGIQPLQAGIRSLIVDSCPAHQQSLASAWASRLTGVGNIIGYLFGFVPVSQMLPFLAISQFAWLCIVASFILAITTIITCYCISEQDPRTLASPSAESSSFASTLRHILWSAQTMPRIIQHVCVVQFFAWLGWFPYLFYVSSWVGNLYAAPLLARDVSSTMQARIIEDAVRLGSLASLVFAVFALLTNMLIPSLISDTAKSDSLSHPLRRITMTKAWALSHLLFSGTLMITFFAWSQTAAMLVTALVGISWAFTLWVPFAIIGKEIAARQERNAKVLEGTLEMEPARQDQAGAIMGLHNVAVSAPQILAAMVCGIVFWAAPKLGIQDDIGWVLRFGSVGGLVAGLLAIRIDI